MPPAYAAFQAAAPSPAGFAISMTIEDMRDLLRRRCPASTAEALRMLREAYPAAPLRLRIAACGA